MQAIRTMVTLVCANAPRYYIAQPKMIEILTSLISNPNSQTLKVLAIETNLSVVQFFFQFKK